MSHVLFAIGTRDELSKEDQAQIAHLTESLQNAKALGLTAQAAAISTEIATYNHHIATPAMTDDELAIWRAFLPTVYNDGRDRDKNLAEYTFDRVPSVVLRLWARHKKAKNFERYEIWSPEQSSPDPFDPILVGVNGNARHLLARWGESDANLISFDDIKRELERRWKQGWNLNGSEAFPAFEAAWGSALCTFFFLLVGSSVTAFFFRDMVESMGLLVGILWIAICVLGGYVGWRTTLMRRFASDPLIRAIRRHDESGTEPALLQV